MDVPCGARDIETAANKVPAMADVDPPLLLLPASPQIGGAGGTPALVPS
jgi:hypothetical protein